MNKTKINVAQYSLIVFLLMLVGCAGIPTEALKWTPETLKDRQLQTRKFQTDDEEKMLVACAGLLQDLGFSIDESETKLGVMLGTKDRSAVNAGQVGLAILVAAFGGGAMPIDDHQKMRASVITRVTDDGSTLVRVTFQRLVWNTHGQVTTSEALKDPKHYQEFFEKLSKAIFLEAHEI